MACNGLQWLAMACGSPIFVGEFPETWFFNQGFGTDLLLLHSIQHQPSPSFCSEGSAGNSPQVYIPKPI
jgi:hypothetical protein